MTIEHRRKKFYAQIEIENLVAELLPITFEVKNSEKATAGFGFCCYITCGPKDERFNVSIMEWDHSHRVELQFNIGRYGGVFRITKDGRKLYGLKQAVKSEIKTHNLQPRRQERKWRK